MLIVTVFTCSLALSGCQETTLKDPVATQEECIKAGETWIAKHGGAASTKDNFDIGCRSLDGQKPWN